MSDTLRKHRKDLLELSANSSKKVKRVLKSGEIEIQDDKFYGEKNYRKGTKKFDLEDPFTRKMAKRSSHRLQRVESNEIENDPSIGDDE